MIVFYRLTDLDGVSTAQCRFVEPRDENDNNLIASINREIEDFIPAEDRRYNSTRHSWEVTSNHWSRVSALIEGQSLQLRERDIRQDGFRTNTRDIAILSCLSAIPLFLFMLLNVASHAFNWKNLGVPIRPWLSLALLLLAFVSFRFGHYLQGVFACLLVVLFNPLKTFYVENWYIWQLFNLSALAFIVFAGFRSASTASRERELDLWFVHVRD